MGEGIRSRLRSDPRLGGLRSLFRAVRGAPRPLPSRNEVQISDGFYGDDPPLPVRTYQPVGVATGAALLDVHGGDWIAGDRTQYEVLDRGLASNGILVAAIDYRLAPRHTFPTSVQDVNAAIRWLRGRADGIPAGAFGSSAGGHLVLLNAMQPDNPEYGHGARLDFAVLDAPVSDPVVSLGSYPEPHPYWLSGADVARGDPLLVLERGEATALPPILIVHGETDELVPVAMSRTFAERYRATGGSAELRVFSGVGHAFFLLNPRSSQSTRMARAILKFCHAHARGGAG